MFDNIGGFTKEEKEKFNDCDLNTMNKFLDRFKGLPEEVVIKIFFKGLNINLTNVDDNEDYYFYVCIKLLQRFCDNEKFVDAILLLISSPPDVDLNEIIVGSKKINLERKDKLEALKYQTDMQIIFENISSLFWLFNIGSNYDLSLLMKLTRKLLFSVLYNIQEDDTYCETIAKNSTTWINEYEKMKSWLDS